MRGSRALDVALSLALLPVAALAALPLALAVFLDSPGTVLFRSPRLGREGRPFAMLKFRTMRTGPARLRGGGAAARHVADREGAYLESILPLKVQIDLRYVETEGSIAGDLIYVGRTALLPFQRVAARVWTSLTGPRPAPATLSEGAFALRWWAPVALLVLVLLAVGARVSHPRLEHLPALAALAAWALLSALWDDTPGPAVEGAARKSSTPASRPAGCCWSACPRGPRALRRVDARPRAAARPCDRAAATGRWCRALAPRVASPAVGLGKQRTCR